MLRPSNGFIDAMDEARLSKIATAQYMHVMRLARTEHRQVNMARMDFKAKKYRKEYDRLTMANKIRTPIHRQGNESEFQSHFEEKNCFKLNSVGECSHEWTILYITERFNQIFSILNFFLAFFFRDF